jgi:hypothetical protein
MRPRGNVITLGFGSKLTIFQGASPSPSSPSIPFVGYAINDADSTEELCQIVF